MKKIISAVILIGSLSLCGQNKEDKETLKKRQEAIIEEYVTNCAEKHNYNYNMSEWQNCLDEGLKKDSTIAYLWQQKAMPFFKARKYEIGMKYIDKAVQYDAQRWQSYRAFIKCIFAKTYKNAIIDFEDCKDKFGNNYEMDHTYNFYIGLSYLQLNEYNKAEIIFKEYIDDMYKNRQGLEHPTAYFYYGISQYEEKKYNEAIITFDKALKIYPNFSDVKYYKAICMARLGAKQEDIKKLFDQVKEDAKKGYTINEDNTIYETYPYQIKWND
jgi:tetratricopeptide (TPR) repeat protein